MNKSLLKARIIKYFFTTRFCVYSNSTLKINFYFRFFKIALNAHGKKLLECEYSNYQYILSQNAFRKYIPQLHFFLLGPFTFLSLQKLYKLKKIESLINVFSDLLANSYRIKLRDYINDPKRLFLNDRQKIFIIDKFKNLQMDIIVGLVHGDLHQRNIMVDAAGSLKFIDLDFSAKNEFIFFDLINIFYSERIFTHGREWQETLIDLYKDLDFKFLGNFWHSLNCEEQQLYLYLYAFKRDYDEASKMTNIHWNVLFECINKLSESK